MDFTQEALIERDLETIKVKTGKADLQNLKKQVFDINEKKRYVNTICNPDMRAGRVITLTCPDNRNRQIFRICHYHEESFIAVTNTYKFDRLKTSLQKIDTPDLDEQEKMLEPESICKRK